MRRKGAGKFGLIQFLLCVGVKAQKLEDMLEGELSASDVRDVESIGMIGYALLVSPVSDIPLVIGTLSQGDL